MSNLSINILITKMYLEALMYYHTSLGEIHISCLLRNINNGKISWQHFRKWPLFLLAGFFGRQQPRLSKEFKEVLSFQKYLFYSIYQLKINLLNHQYFFLMKMCPNGSTISHLPHNDIAFLQLKYFTSDEYL